MYMCLWRDKALTFEYWSCFVKLSIICSHIYFSVLYWQVSQVSTWHHSINQYSFNGCRPQPLLFAHLTAMVSCATNEDPLWLKQEPLPSWALVHALMTSCIGLQSHFEYILVVVNVKLRHACIYICCCFDVYIVLFKTLVCCAAYFWRCSFLGDVELKCWYQVASDFCRGGGRPNWKEERKMNTETFGVSGTSYNRRGGRGRGGRGYYGRGRGGGWNSGYRGIVHESTV